MSTKTERAIVNRRRAAKNGDLFVPIIERLLEVECIPEDEDDFRFLDMLARARALPRREGVYSPSMLGSCLRQVWLAKRGTEKHRPRDAQTNGYFLTGNFVHFKWQFAVWKAHRAGLLELVSVPVEHEYEIVKALYQEGEVTQEQAVAWMAALDFYGDDTRPGVEVRVVDGDYGGTIDVLVRLRGHHVVDFKGLNQVDFQRTIKNGASAVYRKQIVGYGSIANKVLALDPPIEECLLVCENKSGPSGGRGSPLALHETRVRIDDFEGEVSRRLRTLRYYEAREEMPAPECVSTLHMSYQGCPFSRFCTDEVRAVQREREAAARRRNGGARPARPQRG